MTGNDRFVPDEQGFVYDIEVMGYVSDIFKLLNELNRLADGNEEQLLKVMSYLHDKHYDIWEEVNKECFNDRE